MKKINKPCVVIPAYNEAEVIAGVVWRCREHIGSVLVVDDGSGDRTAEAAEKAGAEVIVHPRNLGKGAAIRTGFGRVLEGEWDAMIILDADGQHDPEEMEEFLRAAEEEDADIVLGNRMQATKEMPLVRRWTNRFMSSLLTWVAGQPISDCSCGYRLIRRRVLEKVTCHEDRFNAEQELLIRASREGFRIVSVPVSTIYIEGRVSKIHPVRDTVRFFRMLWRMRRENRGQRSDVRGQ